MDNEQNKNLHSLLILSYVNVIIWAIAIIAMVFLMKDFSGVKKLFPILCGGIAIGVSILSIAGKIKKMFK